MKENFSISSRSGYVVVDCGEDLTSHFTPLLLIRIDQLRQKELKEASGLILDLSGCTRFDHSLLRAGACLHKTLRMSNATLRILGASNELIDFIKRNGMDSILEPIELNDQKSAQKLDITFVNPFVEGTIATLRVQCSTEVTTGRPFMKPPEGLPASAIAGVIGLTSKSFNGSIALCFPEATFLGIMMALLGEPQVAITPELEDGAGELLNIIFGQAKVKLNEAGHQIQKAIPTVIRGKDITIKHLTPQPTLVLPFQCSHGDFHIEVGLESRT